ncbi:protein of unknown function [Methylorubrum extorquens]|uniref:Uncharacterized protein n=1 Tax=Methylorubrum extorquens TaxID=408 RepID=A0A2N9ATG8_METEX|nr:protein of unknown function [Methylorubrum extorquens]
MLHEARTIDLEALIEAEYAALRRHFEERLAPLLVKRALRDAADKVPVPVGDIPVSGPAPTARYEASRAGSPVARLVIEALLEAPGHRMYGPDLTRIVLDAGYTLDCAEKVKTRLKKQGILLKDRATTSWSLAPRFLETGAVIPVRATPHVAQPRETPVGRMILEALTAAGEAGLAGEDLVEAVRSRGFPMSQVHAVRGSLRAEGHIACGLGQNARWRIVRPGQAEPGEPSEPASAQA